MKQRDWISPRVFIKASTRLPEEATLYPFTVFQVFRHPRSLRRYTKGRSQKSSDWPQERLPYIFRSYLQSGLLGIKKTILKQKPLEMRQLLSPIAKGNN